MNMCPSLTTLNPKPLIPKTLTLKPWKPRFVHRILAVWSGLAASADRELGAQPSRFRLGFMVKV